MSPIRPIFSAVTAVVPAPTPSCFDSIKNLIARVIEGVKKIFCCGKAENVQAKSMLQTIERRHVEMQAELDAYNQVIALHERNGENGEYVDNLRRRVNDLQERANLVAAQGREIARENGWTFLGR